MKITKNVYNLMNRTIAKNCRNLNKNLKESLFEFFFIMRGYAVIKSDKKPFWAFNYLI